MRFALGPPLALVTAALGQECFLSQPAFPPQDETIRLLVRDWPSHRLVTEIASILLREQLKFNVELAMPNSAPLKDYELISRGDFDANVELWPSGKDREYKQWVMEGHAVLAGEHAAVSAEGMHIPNYLVQQDWTAAFHRSLQKPSAERKFSEVTHRRGEASADASGAAGLCQSAAWNCTDFVWQPSHCLREGAACTAQVLHGPVSWFQGKAEQLIEGNSLNFSVSYLTMDALNHEVWDAYAGGKAFIFYDWSPREPIHGLDSSLFSRVRFPPADNDCLAAQDDVTPLGGNSCDQPKRALQKVVSHKLTNVKDALYLINSLTLDQTDYDDLFKDYEISGQDARKAACQWLKRVGKDRWGSWLQYSRSGPLMPTPELGGCWGYVWIQAGLLLIGNIMFWLARWVRWTRACPGRRKEVHATMNGVVDSQTQDLEEARKPNMTIAEAAAATTFKGNMKSGRIGFLEFRRSEADFLSADGSRVPLPTGHGSFRVQTGSTSKFQLVWYAVESSMGETLKASFRFACIIGVLGSLVHISREHAHFWMKESFIEPFVEPFARVVKDFGMLPAFMVALSVNATVANWMTWLGYAGGAYGRIVDLSLIVGGIDVVDRKEDAETWKSIKFKFYRYFNALHYLCFHEVDPRFGNDPVKISDSLAQAGLLTLEEAAQLGQSLEMHSTVLVWLSLLWDQQVAPKLSAGQRHKTQNFVEKITTLRTMIGSTKAQVNFGPPDITRGMLYAVTSTLLSFILISYPLTMYVSDQCFQWSTILCGTLYIFCYHGLLTMGDTLNKGPFDPACDCVNADHLLCWAELSVYQMLQVSSTTLKQDACDSVGPTLLPTLFSAAHPQAASDKKLEAHAMQARLAGEQSLAPQLVDL